MEDKQHIKDTAEKVLGNAVEIESAADGGFLIRSNCWRLSWELMEELNRRTPGVNSICKEGEQITIEIKR